MRLTFLERSRRRDPGVWDAGRRRLLARLGHEQQWLTGMWLEIRDSVDTWAGLEQIARFVYELEGCVIGPAGCDKDAPVRCQACAGKQDGSK